MKKALSICALILFTLMYPAVVAWVTVSMIILSTLAAMWMRERKENKRRRKQVQVQTTYQAVMLK